MLRTFQIKLRPTLGQALELEYWLDRCRNLYNACLEQRILSYKQGKVWPNQKKAGAKLSSRWGQQNQIPELKEDLPEFAVVCAQVLQEVVGRVERTFSAFFTRNRTIKTGGFPRFKSKSRYDSFTHPQASYCKLDKNNREFYLPSFGWVRYHDPRLEIPEGKSKTCTVKRTPDGWWLYIALDIPAESKAHLPPTGKQVGLDMGLKALVTTDSGEVLGDLGPAKEAEKRIRLTQRTLSRKVKGSNRYRKQKLILANQHLRLSRTKKLQLHTISRKLVRENDLIVVEDLDIKGMLEKAPSGAISAKSRKGLNRNIGLASWAALVWMLTYKAEDAGRRVVKIDPRGTSQECSGCGCLPLVRKTLKNRIHTCPECGLVLDRDHNAATNILNRGLRLLETENENGKHSPVVNSMRFPAPSRGSQHHALKREVG